MANVAVDALLRKVVEEYRSIHPQGDILIARVFSQAQIAAQYATGEPELIDEEHPEQIGHGLRTQYPPPLSSQYETLLVTG